MKDLCNISSTSPNQTITSSSSSKLNSPKSSKKSANVVNGTITTFSDLFGASHTTTKKDESTNVEYMEVDNGEEPSSTQQFELSDVVQLVKRPLRLGDCWYIVDKKWYDRCLSYIEFEDNTYHPGKIDNGVLLVAVKNNAQKNYTEPMFRLKADLTEDVDYAVIPEEVWNLFLDKFGIVSGIGSNHIRCPVLDKGKSYLIVEIYPLELRLALYGSKEDMVAQYSRNTTLRTIVSDMRSLFRVNESRPVQLWHNATLLVAHSDDVISSTSLMASNNSISSSTNNHFATTSNIPSPPPPPPSPSSSGGQKQSNNDIDLRLLDLELAPNTVLTIEPQNLDSTWPSSRTKLGAITRSKVASGVPIASPGVCGLMNLGNTCFMNAALQCLSNTPPLTNFLLADRHLEDINPDNPLGMGGEIARCYSELIKAIWSGHHVTLTPRDFKVAVGRFAPQFMGFAQHDCQELMAFLLDGLHEDLNRVKVKPYIEMNNDLELRPDEIVAAESWSNYKRRNDSIIVDTFHSQLKSTLVCPECNLVSVTFDPFCYLTLPLPYKRERSVDITFVPATSKRPLYTPQRSLSRFATSSSTVSSSTSTDSSPSISNQIPARSIIMESIMIPKEGIISEICTVVAKLLNDSCGPDGKNALGRKVDFKQLVVANVFGNRLSKVYSSDDPYSIHFEDIVVYEKEDCPTASGEVSTGPIQNLSTKIEGYHLPVFIREFDPSSGENPISRPFFIYVKTLSYEDIQEAIFKELVGLVSPTEREAFFKSLKEENIKDDKMDVASSTSNKNQSFKRQVASSLQDGSDGEGSEMDDEDDSQSRQQVTHSVGDDEDAEDEDEGVETSGYYTRSSKNSFQNTPFTISVVDMHATNEFTILRAGVRIDSPTNTYLAININSRIVSKYFTRNVNSVGQAKLSSILPSFSMPQKTLITLDECINQFTLTEKLGAEDPWYCPRCKKHQMASKKFDVWLLPNILIIHMKRFSYSRIHRDKLDVIVDFPIKDLDMTSYVLHNPNNEKYTYDLIGVANHYGGLGGGHYTAYAKNMINNVWYYFDDSSVSAVSENNVVTKSAYVLFYQRHQTNINNNAEIVQTADDSSSSSVNNSKLS